MTMKNIVLGLLCCSIVSTGLFLTACRPSENDTGVIIHENGTTSLVEGPGAASKGSPLEQRQRVEYALIM